MIIEENVGRNEEVCRPKQKGDRGMEEGEQGNAKYKRLNI